MHIEPLFLTAGREGPVHPYPKILEAEVLEVIASGVGADYQRMAQMKVAAMECPVHHQKAQISVVTVEYAEVLAGFEGDQKIDTCCQEFLKAVLSTLQ
jgi:hypothetical protein